MNHPTWRLVVNGDNIYVDDWYYFELLHKHWLAQTKALVRCVANEDDEEWQKTVNAQNVTGQHQRML